MPSESSARLSRRHLHSLGERGMDVPGYDISQLVARVVHIGVGNFHRAHLAAYLHQAAQAGSEWGIRGVGLLPGDRTVADALAAQDHLYTLTTKDDASSNTAVIGSILDVVVAPEDPAPAIAAIAAPEVRVLSMTVTEAGYGPSPLSRRTFDVVAAALARRRAEGLGGLTVLSCDNLPGNGRAALGCVRDAATRLDARLAGWIEEACTFPDSMVDRITPATTDAHRAEVAQRWGIVDQCPVFAEPFQQWVLEDQFATGRPDLAAVGATFTTDVRAWELYKLRLLNAGHSVIAYAAALAGITHVDEAFSHPTLRRFVERYHRDEAVPTLARIPGHPPEDYAATVLQRFTNTALRDQVARLCVDGTSKFGSFVMPTLEHHVAGGGSVAFAAHALACWAHYLADLPEVDQAPDAHGAATRQAALAATVDPARFVVPAAGFPEPVTRSSRFVDEFVRAHRAVGERGPLAALAAVVSDARGSTSPRSATPRRGA